MIDLGFSERDFVIWSARICKFGIKGFKQTNSMDYDAVGG